MIQADTAQLPVIVTELKDKYTMYIPDLRITVDGDDYVELYARATVCASAILYYNKEHNLTTSFKTTYEDIVDKCVSKNQFPTYLSTI